VSLEMMMLGGRAGGGVGAGVGVGGGRCPFTASQWQELEHQALIYKYMASGVPIPSDLLLPLRRSFLLDSALATSPSLGYPPQAARTYPPSRLLPVPFNVAAS
jgi:hypothetical protein